MWYDSFIPGFMTSGNNFKNIKKLNEFENKLESQNTFMQLLNLTLDTYKWENLPETCNSRFLELMLVTNGFACLHKDKEKGLLSLAFMYKSFNLYGEAVTGTAWGFDGTTKQCECFTEGGFNDFADTVYCRSNLTSYPMLNYIKIYANRLSDLMRSMDVVQRQIKSPFIISCEESQLMSVEKVLNDTQENKIAIVTSKMLDSDMFKVLQTGVKAENLNVLREQYVEIMNMFLTLIGVANISNSTKKERMIVAEADSNNEITNDYLYEGLCERQKFAENCNKLFGTNISVKVNETREYKTDDTKKEAIAKDKGESENENI